MNGDRSYRGGGNELSYKGFLFLGGLSNPRCYIIHRSNGSYKYITYHLRSIYGY
jgi:hypothetical protein